MKGTDNMKKYLAFLLAFVMILFTACGTTQINTTDPSGETKNTALENQNVTTDGTDETTATESSEETTQGTQNTEGTNVSITDSTDTTQGNTQPTQGTTGTTKPTTETTKPTQGSTTNPTTGTTATESIAQPTTPTEPTNKPTTPTSTTKTLTINTPAYTTVFVGETLQIDYDYSGNSSNLTWTSSDTAILTVNSKGVVTGVSAGTTIVKATDGDITRRVAITVEAQENKTTSFDLRVNGPLYDGVTKYVGDYLKFNLWTVCLNSNGQSNNRTDPMRVSSYQTDPSKHTATNSKRNLYISSSNPNVVSVTNEYDCGFYEDYLHFNGAGTAIITITSWDGYSESYTITVKGDYDCNPGKSQLTPEEFAHYATQVGVELGQTRSDVLSGYRYLYKADDELTWSQACGVGKSLAHEWYGIGIDYILVTYAGWSEEYGKHLFYVGY